MIAEAKGDSLGHDDFFMQVNPSFIRKRRNVGGGASTPSNKLPNASELAWMAQNNNDSANPKPEGVPDQNNEQERHNSGSKVACSQSFVGEHGEDEFYDPELAAQSSNNNINGPLVNGAVEGNEI